MRGNSRCSNSNSTQTCGTLFTSRNVNSTSNNTNLIPLGNAYRPGLLLQDNDGHNTGSVRRVSSHRIRKQYRIARKTHPARVGAVAAATAVKDQRGVRGTLLEVYEPHNQATSQWYAAYTYVRSLRIGALRH